MSKTSLFGKYNILVDESGHILFSLMISLIGLFLGLDIEQFIICFLAGILIDLDHLLNFVIAKFLKVKNYKKDILYGSGGYTFKILHGFDLALLFSFIIYFIFQDLLFSSFLFFSLSLHELWDFLVYPHSWRELFFITRASCRFRPGMRKKFIGKIFDLDTLKY